MMFPKPQRIKSKKLTDSAQGRGCTLRYCTGSTNETVVFCHVRIGSGVATKPPDFFGFYACQPCHDMQERGEASPREVLRALLETQTLMWRDGLLVTKGATPR